MILFALLIIAKRNKSVFIGKVWKFKKLAIIVG